MMKVEIDIADAIEAFTKLIDRQNNIVDIAEPRSLRPF